MLGLGPEKAEIGAREGRDGTPAVADRRTASRPDMSVCGP